MIINTKIEANRDVDYTQNEQLSTLLTLFDKGIITKAELLERIPDGMVENIKGINREATKNEGN